MIFYKERKKIYRIILSNLRYYHCLISTRRIKSKEKRLYIDISNITFNRHLYNFLKYFDLNGYTVFMPKNKRIINELYKKNGEFKYTSWLLEEKIIKFGDWRTVKKALDIKKEQLSNDYFIHCEKNLNYFFVPMGQYPLNYRFEEMVNWDIGNPRKKSIFMAGNMDTRFYYNIEKNPIFNLLSRRRVYDHLTGEKRFMKMKSLKDLTYYISSDADNQVVLIDTQNDFSIGLQNLKKITRQFNFYLALPGTVIPHCHNLIEAMSVGCIPIIQKSYAQSLHPNLENNKNSLFFEDLKDLDEVINKAFNFSDLEILNLRVEVLDYFNSHLTANAIVAKIENKNFNKILIQGGMKSVEKAVNSVESFKNIS